MDNEIADSLSRNFSSSVEWELSRNVFDAIVSEWGQPDIDLFASRHNVKLKVYCSWLPDSYCTKVDAFFFPWTFPPFRLVGKCWRKMIMNKTNAILIIPDWPTQPWYSLVIKGAKQILRFSAKDGNLTSPFHKELRRNFGNVPIIANL